MRSSYRFIVSGQVQGVGFRYSAQGVARRLNLSGWVGNRADGRVEGVACGAPDPLESFKAWLRQGPAMAKVDAVEWVETKEAPEGASFEIRRG